MLVRDMLENSGEKFAEIPAIRWLEKKNIVDRN